MEAKVAARREELAARAEDERRWSTMYRRPGAIVLLFAFGVGTCIGAGMAIQAYEAPPAPAVAPLETGCAGEQALYNRGWQQCRSEQDDLGIKPRCVCTPGDPICACLP